MEEILHDLGCIKPWRRWDKLPINWCRISFINSIPSPFMRTLILINLDYVDFPCQLPSLSIKFIQFTHLYTSIAVNIQNYSDSKDKPSTSYPDCHLIQRIGPDESSRALSKNLQHRTRIDGICLFQDQVVPR